MRKFLAFILATTLCVSFVGCGKEEKNETSSASSVASGPSVFVGNGGNKTNSSGSLASDGNETQVNNSQASSIAESQSGSSNASQSDNSSGKPQSNSSPSKNSSASSNGSSSVYVPSSNSSQASSVYKDPIPANAPRIICWGDSITYGMGMQKGCKYPDVLQKLLGNKYRVLNAGGSGEKSHTIAARQGAYTVTLDRDLVFKAGYGSVYLDGVNGPNLVIDDGSVLDINEDGESFRNDLPCKKVYIKGKEYEITYSGGKLEILRDDYNKKLVIKKGTKVEFDSARKQQGSYCEIFYVGANDGNPDVDVLVNRYKAMAKRQGSDRYIVIIPQWAPSKYTAALKEEFGDKAFDIRVEMCTTDPEKNFGLYVSAEDKNRMENGQIPLMYMYNNSASDTLHFSETGYEVMAKLLYAHGKKLGYWK